MFKFMAMGRAYSIKGQKGCNWPNLRRDIFPRRRGIENTAERGIVSSYPQNRSKETRAAWRPPGAASWP